MTVFVATDCCKAADFSPSPQEFRPRNIAMLIDDLRELPRLSAKLIHDRVGERAHV
jgi:hypothetical protein